MVLIFFGPSGIGDFQMQEIYFLASKVNNLRKILPIFTSTAALTIEQIPTPFSAYKAVDFRKTNEDHIQQILDGIGTAVAEREK